MSEDIPVTEGTPAEAAESPFQRKLSDADWLECKNLYELGKAGVTELADKYGCSRQNLSTRFKAAGVKRSSRAHEIVDAATAAAKKAAADAAASEQKFSHRRSEMIEETRMSGLAALKQSRVLAQKTVVDAVRAGIAVATTNEDLKALTRYNKILVDNINAALRVLNADEHVDEDDLPTLIVENLTSEDILAHHKSTGALPEDADLDDLNLQHEYYFEDEE